MPTALQLLVFLALLLAGYLSGAIPTAYLMGRMLKGIDIREHGSGNPGATNVFRVVGAGAGVFTLCFDALKGFVPVWAVLKTLPEAVPLATLVGLCAIAGHNWTVFLNFKGGKGVATSAGVFLALAPKAVFASAVVFLAGFGLSRHVSVGSVLSAASLPFTLWFYTESLFLAGVGLAAGAAAIVLHRGNIRKLLERPKNPVAGGER